jgi:hypothetical protein
MFQPKRLQACAPYPQACGGGQHWIRSCKLKFLHDLVHICFLWVNDQKKKHLKRSSLCLVSLSVTTIDHP